MTVLHSINNPDGSLCVDIFRRDDASIGFEEFRRDPEDPGRGWYAVGGYSKARFGNVETAIAAATDCVAWFNGI